MAGAACRAAASRRWVKAATDTLTGDDARTACPEVTWARCTPKRIELARLPARPPGTRGSVTNADDRGDPRPEETEESPHEEIPALPDEDSDFASEHSSPTIADQMPGGPEGRPEHESPKGYAGMDS